MFGLCCQMGGLEAVLTGFGDLLRLTRFGKLRFWREAFTGVVVGSAGLFALQNITNVRWSPWKCTILAFLNIV